jgi:hypothetical protein
MGCGIMKRSILTTAIAVLPLTTVVFADPAPYSWTISSSSTDPFVNTGPATSGVATKYLWLVCSDVPGTSASGMSSAAFGIVEEGIDLLGINPMNGFLNASSDPSCLLLAVGGCPSGPVVVASIVVLDFPGTLCLAPCPSWAEPLTVDCEATPAAWGVAWIGYSNRGGPCGRGALCGASVTLCPGSIDAPPGQRIEVPIVLDSEDPLELDAFGFDLVFDSEFLTYVASRPGELTEPWDQFGTNLLEGGRLRIGAFTVTPSEVTGAEPLAHVVFDVDPLATGGAGLGTMNLTDDIETVFPCYGEVSFFCFSDGDVNEDGALSAGDALCAFKCYLGFGEMPAECQVGSGCERVAADADCDGECEPGDALWILEQFLCDDPPLHCGGLVPTCLSPEAPGVRAGVGGTRFRLAAATIPPGATVEIPLEVGGDAPLRSFGLTLTHPAGTEIVALRRAEATESWAGLGEGCGEARAVRLGGFDPAGIVLSRSDWTTIGRLVVHATDDAAGSGSFELVEATDDLGPVEFTGGEVTFTDVLPSRPALETGRPNPFRESVVIQYDVPSGPPRPVEIKLYNVRGQLVRTLVDGVAPAGRHEIEWRGLDDADCPVAAGTYFYRMRTGAFEVTRTVVLTR